MKEFNVNKDQKTEEISIKEARKEIQLIDSNKLVPGLNMFELNLETFAIRQIKPIGVDAHIIEKANLITGQKQKGMNTINRVKYSVKENCKYVQSTNLKNATKKFEKYIIKELRNKIS